MSGARHWRDVGEWRARLATGEHRFDQVVVSFPHDDYAGAVIATVYSHGGVDARLMAAAPELLAALQAARALIKTYAPAAEEARDMMAQIDRAIVKASGNSE